VSHSRHTNPASLYILSSEHLSALSSMTVFNWTALQEMEYKPNTAIYSIPHTTHTYYDTCFQTHHNTSSTLITISVCYV